MKGVLKIRHALTIISAYVALLIPMAAHAQTAASGTPTQIKIIQQPEAGASEELLPVQPIVHIVDENGDIVTTDNTTSVTVTLTGDGAPVSRLRGDTNSTAVNGVVTFSNLILSGRKEPHFTLEFSAPGLESAASDEFYLTGSGEFEAAWVYDPFSTNVLTLNRTHLHETVSPNSPAEIHFVVFSDLYLNGVEGIEVTFTPTNGSEISASPDGPTSTDPVTITTGVNGHAIIGQWIAGPDPNTVYSINVDADVINYTGVLQVATSAEEAVAGIKIERQPIPGESGSPLHQQPIIQVVDGVGNPVAIENFDVSVRPASTSPELTLTGAGVVIEDGGTPLKTDENGRVEFNLTATTSNIDASTFMLFEVGALTDNLLGVLSDELGFSEGETGRGFSLNIHEGNNQYTIINEILPLSPVARVTSVNGLGAPNVRAEAEVIQGGGSFSQPNTLVNFGSFASDLMGYIALDSEWEITLGTNQLRMRLSESSSDIGSNEITFTATGVELSDVGLSPDSVTPQIAFENSPVASPPSVRATTGNGNGVSNVPVTFTVSDTSDSTISAGQTTDAKSVTILTDSNGIATLSSWMIGSGTLQVHEVLATTTSGQAVTFTAAGSQNTTIGDLEVAHNSLENQPNAIPGQNVEFPPSVLVTDETGSPVGNITVTFDIVALEGEIPNDTIGDGQGNGSAYFLEVQTDGNGIASLDRWMIGPELDVVSQVSATAFTTNENDEVVETTNTVIFSAGGGEEVAVIRPEDPDKAARKILVTDTAIESTGAIVEKTQQHLDVLALNQNSRFSGLTPSGAPPDPEATPLALPSVGLFNRTPSPSISLRDFVSGVEFHQSLNALAETDWREKAQALQDGATREDVPRTPPSGTPKKPVDLSEVGTMTVWGVGNWTNMKNTRNDDVDARYDGDIFTYSIGTDYRLRRDLVLGMALSYAETDVTTTYNLGTYDERTYTFTPYMQYNREDLVFSLSGGIGMGEVDLTGNEESVFTATTDSTTLYLQGDLQQTYRFLDRDALELTPSISLLRAAKVLDAHTNSDGTEIEETTTDIFRLNPELRAGYRYDFRGVSLTPFVRGGIIYDFMDSVNDDSGAYNIGAGTSLIARNGLSSSLEYEREIGRDDFERQSLTGSLVYGFRLSPYDSLTPRTRFINDQETGLTQSYGLDYTHDRGIHRYGTGVDMDIKASRERQYGASMNYTWAPTPNLSFTARTGSSDIVERTHDTRLEFQLNF